MQGRWGLCPTPLKIRGAFALPPHIRSGGLCPTFEEWRGGLCRGGGGGVGLFSVPPIVTVEK